MSYITLAGALIVKDCLMIQPEDQMQPQSGKNMLESRREVLKLAALGLPSVMTLRASAQEALVSQLRCTVTLDCDLVAMVDEAGAVTLAPLRWSTIPPLTQDVIDQIRNNASFVFPAGTAPNEYLPAGNCNFDDDSSGDNSDNDNDNDNDDNNFASDRDEDSDEGSGGKKKKKKKKKKKNKNNRGDRDEDSDENSNGDNDENSNGDNDENSDEDNDEDRTYECAYNVFVFPCGTFPVTDFVDQAGNPASSGFPQLYWTLASTWVEQQGNTGFPGISCVASVLTYFGRG